MYISYQSSAKQEVGMNTEAAGVGHVGNVDSLNGNVLIKQLESLTNEIELLRKDLDSVDNKINDNLK